MMCSPVGQVNGSITSFSYDANYQVKNIVHNKSDSSIINSVEYQYDANGNRISQLEANGDRVTYTYDATNQITTNTWDYKNRLKVVELPTNKTITYTYGITRRSGEEMRVKKDDGTTTTKYIWDAANIVSETDELNNITAQFTYDPVAYGNLISQRRVSTTNYYHFDSLGSTQALTNATETITDDYLFNAFGETIDSNGSTINPYQYVGQAGYYFNADTNSHTLRMREYDAEHGRFISFDPIHFAAGDVNLYRYVGNRLFLVIDPSGLRKYTKKIVVKSFINGATPIGKITPKGRISGGPAPAIITVVLGPLGVFIGKTATARLSILKTAVVSYRSNCVQNAQDI